MMTLILMMSGWIYAASFGDVGYQSAEADVEVAATIDNCVADQDVNSPDIDISACPKLPNSPGSMNVDGTSDSASLGMYELERTRNGRNYAISTLSGSIASNGADEQNVECWAKGYFRLRQILQNPPPEYLQLRAAGYQRSFYQYQIDERVRSRQSSWTRGHGGPSNPLAPYKTALIKWVTIVTPDGGCEIPTYENLRATSKLILAQRGL